jgi:hypothetical protein
MHSKRRTLIALAALGLLLGAVLAGFLWAGSPVRAFAQEITDDEEDALEGPDVPITGDALERASRAALDYLGEGRVTETEVGDEEGYYEIEITLDNGRQVDVHLDQAFNVLGQEGDGAGDDD